jgi:hypothetical protein
MSDFDRRLYDVLTSDTETGNRLNYEMFGDNEWSGVDRAEYLERLRDRIDADSYQGGA